MIGIIKSDIRYDVLGDYCECVISRDLKDFVDIRILVLPFGGIDSYYNIKQSNLNLIDILNVNDVEYIFTGKANEKLKELCEFRNIQLVEFLNDKYFLVENSKLTARGIIEYLQKDNYSLGKDSIFIMGYGNISYILCKLLKIYDVDFYVYGNNEVEEKYILLEGYKLGKISDVKYADIIINTIPSNYIGDYSIFKDKRIIDVASSPYGFDISEIDNYSLSYEIVSAIPSKYFYKSAGMLIYKTIEKYLQKC